MTRDPFADYGSWIIIGVMVLGLFIFAFQKLKSDEQLSYPPDETAIASSSNQLSYPETIHDKSPGELEWKRREGK